MRSTAARVQAPPGGTRTENCGPRDVRNVHGDITALIMVPIDPMTEPTDQCDDVARKVEQFEKQRLLKDDDHVILVQDMSDGRSASGSLKRTRPMAKIGQACCQRPCMARASQAPKGKAAARRRPSWIVQPLSLLA